MEKTCITCERHEPTGQKTDDGIPRVICKRYPPVPVLLYLVEGINPKQPQPIFGATRPATLGNDSCGEWLPIPASLIQSAND